jgi:NTP pyrophosphatase (non-canonical NTP hydrolase)
MLNDLAKEIYETSKSKGFWSIDQVSEFSIVPIKLALIGDEVSEALRVHRDEYVDSPQEMNNMTMDQEQDFVEELADIVIRVLDLAGGLGLDIEQSIDAKVKKNKDRPYRHGKRY